MESVALLRFSHWTLLAAIVPIAARAQESQPAPTVAPVSATAISASTGSAAPAAPTAASANAAFVAATTGGVPAVRERTMTARFTQEKPVLGFPLGSAARAHCSTDGTAFYDLTSSASTAGQGLYGVSSDGGVKQVLRKLPIGYTNVLVRDFFAGDQQLVTLLEADKRDGGANAAPSRVTDYFVSLEDQTGDSSELVLLSVRFKPVKVARFVSGDVLMLGWDEGNDLPVLAMLKEDGTVRRFIDFDEPRKVEAREGQGNGPAKDAATRERLTLKALEGATFSALGSEVLLTYPGTTNAVLAMGASGEMRTISITIPAGYVLNDVLVSSGGRGTLVARVKEADVQPKPEADEAARLPKMMLIEYDAIHGSRIGRIVFDKPQVSDVTCAPNSSLVAMFLDAIPDADHVAANGGAGTQLVVSTARR